MTSVRNIHSDFDDRQKNMLITKKQSKVKYTKESFTVLYASALRSSLLTANESVFNGQTLTFEGQYINLTVPLQIAPSSPYRLSCFF